MSLFQNDLMFLLKVLIIHTLLLIDLLSRVEATRPKTTPRPPKWKESDLHVDVISNPESPLATKTSGLYHFNLIKFDSSICAIRVEFEIFELSPPTDGACITDKFNVQDDRLKIPTLCGINSGSHIMLQVDELTTVDPITFSFDISGKGRKWHLKLVQIPCNRENCDIYKRQGCMQLYLSPFGEIKSFDWHGIASVDRLNYAICIDSLNSGYCGITLVGQLSLGEETPVFYNNSLYNVFERALLKDECYDDYLQLPPSDDWSSPGRICGNVNEFHLTIDTSAPIIIYYRSGPNRSSKKGFHIKYFLKPCLK